MAAECPRSHICVPVLLHPLRCVTEHVVMYTCAVCRLQDLKESWKFVLLAIWAAKLPAIGIAAVSTDLPTLIGGMVALAVIGVMCKYRFGLNECASFLLIVGMHFALVTWITGEKLAHQVLHAHTQRSLLVPYVS